MRVNKLKIAAFVGWMAVFAISYVIHRKKVS